MGRFNVARAVVLGAGMAVGAGVLASGCAGDDSVGAAPPSLGTKHDATAERDPAKPAPLCAPPANAASRCTGSDPTFTFFPAFECLPGDAGTGGDADAVAGDAAAVDAMPSDAAPEAGVCDAVNAADVVFTPAACRAFANAEANGTVSTSGGPHAPTWDAPSDGDMLTADHWAIFAWTKGTPARSVPHAFTALRGDAYVIEFTVDCVEILRVMLGETSWAPDPAAWAILTSQTKPVTARVVWMKFTDDALSGTPIASAPITFTMMR